MKRSILTVLFSAAAALLWASPARAQTYFPFGSVTIGQASAGIRIGPVGCDVSASEPTYPAGQIHPCSQTTSGRLRVESAQSSPYDVNATIVGVPTVLVDNLGPSASSAYAGTPCYHVTTASTNAINCRNAAANFYGVVRAINTTTTIAYLRLYNLATVPTCSVATGFVESIPIPPAGSAPQAGGIAAIEIIPTHYTAGLGFCVTGGGTSTDNTNAVAGIYLKLLYK